MGAKADIAVALPSASLPWRASVDLKSNNAAPFLRRRFVDVGPATWRARGFSDACWIRRLGKLSLAPLVRRARSRVARCSAVAAPSRADPRKDLSPARSSHRGTPAHHDALRAD